MYMAKSLKCCLIVLFCALVLGKTKAAEEVLPAPKNNITCVYTYGCVANVTVCVEGCRKKYPGSITKNCQFTWPTCPCACFCMTIRQSIEDCHYPPRGPVDPEDAFDFALGTINDFGSN